MAVTPSMKMEQTQCSETSADEIQMPRNKKKNKEKEIMISPREKHRVFEYFSNGCKTEYDPLCFTLHRSAPPVITCISDV
jgi:hypothetical protein